MKIPSTKELSLTLLLAIVCTRMAYTIVHEIGRL